MVKKLVSNSGDVDRWGPPEEPLSKLLAPEDVKYVIITSDTLEDALQDLADWEIKKGVPARIVNISWIDGGYSGNDTQEKIRNFIKDAKVTCGTKWVLLGGDTNIAPDRKAYANVGSYEDYIPADLYYSDLDGTWDANGIPFPVEEVRRLIESRILAPGK